MRIPEVNLANAIRAYYTKFELNNQDIDEIFERKIGSTLMQSLKKAAKAKMIENERNSYGSYAVVTECAFDAWGLDITELEKRYSKLKKLGLIEDRKDV